MTVTGLTPGHRLGGSNGFLTFFDRDFSGTLDEMEIDFLSKSDIIEQTGDYITLSTPEGEVTYNNIANDRGEEYYQTGSTQVAVVDDFSGHSAYHGNSVSNVIKEENPDLQVSRFDLNTAYPYNTAQKLFMKTADKLEATKDLRAYWKSHPFLSSLYDKIGKTIMPESKNDRCIKFALDKVSEEMKNGKEYKAVNLSNGDWCNYEEINELLGKEIEQGGRIGEPITPENASKYKSEIKQILKERVAQDENLSCESGYFPGTSKKIKYILDTIDTMEELKIPIYIAQSYYSRKPETKGAQTFNWYSLADNAITIEAGKIVDGKVNSPFASTSSFALDKNGKRRIEAPLHFNGRFDYASTSLATPMALAHELKVQKEQE